MILAQIFLCTILVVVLILKICPYLLIQTMGTESPSSSPILQSSPMLIDPSHPLYVHPFDNLGVLLVSVPFTGAEYTSWRKNILIALSAKNKSGLINCKIPQPRPSSPLYGYWVRYNDMVFACLSNSLSKDIADNVLHCDTACDTVILL